MFYISFSSYKVDRIWTDLEATEDMIIFKGLLQWPLIYMCDDCDMSPRVSYQGRLWKVCVFSKFVIETFLQCKE